MQIYAHSHIHTLEIYVRDKNIYFVDVTKIPRHAAAVYCGAQWVKNKSGIRKTEYEYRK